MRTTTGQANASAACATFCKTPHCAVTVLVRALLRTWSSCYQPRTQKPPTTTRRERTSSNTVGGWSNCSLPRSGRDPWRPANQSFSDTRLPELDRPLMIVVSSVNVFVHDPRPCPPRFHFRRWAICPNATVSRSRVHAAERVVTKNQFALSQPAETLYLFVGMYPFPDLKRLPVSQNGALLPNAQIDLGTLAELNDKATR